MRDEIWQARSALVRQYDGLSTAEASQKTGFSAETVRKYRARSGHNNRHTSSDLLVERIGKCAANNLTRQQAADELGISYVWLVKRATAAGIEFRHASSGHGDDRSEVMANMYRAGKTLADIGGIYKISRERVRQIIKKYHSLSRNDGGSHLAAVQRKKRLDAAEEAKCFARYGCSLQERRAIVGIGRGEDGSRYQRPTYAFRAQRKNAQRRGIEWRLTLAEWWQIWQASGKWHVRGRPRDAYVMCRFGDEGPYEVGNVYIATVLHNSTVQRNNPYRKANQSVAA